MSVFAKALKKINDATIDFADDTIKVALIKNTLTVNEATQEFFGDIDTHEATVSGGGSGYTAGGQTLTTKTNTADTSLGKAVLDADNASWTVAGGTLTARYACIYKDSGSAATSPIIAIIDFGADKAATDGAFTIAWNTNGIISFVAA